MNIKKDKVIFGMAELFETKQIIAPRGALLAAGQRGPGEICRNHSGIQDGPSGTKQQAKNRSTRRSRTRR